ncbi:12D3 antigen [Babesia divergens]|uniref:12D3 antigen n=1 Tax=Babesia divergens TaxID=32595 RepID=A0AAD9GCR7_BABDI|nr:12D3 antigen [Babesia divergens]
MISSTFCSLLLFLAPNLVFGFIYRAVPMYEVNGRVNCDTKAIADATCTYKGNAFGKVCEKGPNKGYVLNPYAQTCGTSSKCHPAHDAALGDCAKFTGCYTVSNTTRACTCMSGFFGNPYVQCFKHCETDYDCPSPYAECRKDGNEKIKRCKCKAGCPGDGVICKPNDICAGAEENTEEHRRCLQMSLTDKNYICDTGYYIDTDSRCAKIAALEGEKRVSVIAENFVDGSTINIGKCFSMEINNRKGMSHFYQLNGGDAVVVKQKIVTNPQLYLVFEVKGNDIIAFGLLEEDTSRLTKLFTVSNGLGGCQIDSVTKSDPTGANVSPSNVRVEVNDIATAGNAREEL